MHVRRYPALLAASLAASVCAAATAPAPAPGPVRREAFSEVWTLVRDQFFDPKLRGVDWEAARKTWGARAARAGSREELARAINGMLAELETSHTRFYTVLDPEYWFLTDLFDRDRSGTEGYVGIGVFVSEIEGEIFARSVVDGGPAARAGLLSGDRIVSVDGAPWQEVRNFEGKEGRATTVRVQRSRDGSDVRDLTVIPERIHPVEFYRAAAASSAKGIPRGGITAAYVRIWSYAGQQNHDTLVSLLTSEPLALCDGLILDLRDGWGGANPTYLNLFHHGVPRVTGISRDGVETTYDLQWRKPVVLLVDETTRSGKEMLAHGFRRYRHGPVVGATTAGAVVAGKAFPIGDDGLLYLAVTDIRVDGERLEGRGVAPDHFVPFSLPYSAGADPRLERALDVLRDLIPKKP